MMGDDARYLKSVPTGKHYIANNTEYNAPYRQQQLDERDMRDFI